MKSRLYNLHPAIIKPEFNNIKCKKIKSKLYNLHPAIIRKIKGKLL